MIIISIQLTITAMGDFSQVEVEQAIAEARNEKISEAIDENEKRSKEAFDLALGTMRASYAMVSGISQIIGGGMGAIFSSLYGLAISTIELFSAIAAAQFFVPGMQMQSVMMVASLVSAIVSLAGVMTGQQELSSRVNGITATLQGFQSLIGGFHFS